MDSNSSCDPSRAGQDLSQKWLRHLREASKVTATVCCDFCPNGKVFPTEEALATHIRELHPKQVLRGVHKDTYKKFSEIPSEGCVLSISATFSSQTPTQPSGRSRDGNDPF